MTFEVAKKLLADLRAAKRRANAIKARMADIESDYASIQSSLGGDGFHGGITQSRVEQLALRVQEEREEHIRALETYFALEDKLSDALDTLEPIERDIIIGCYMDGKCNWQVAQDVGYEKRNVQYIKVRAIKKLADSI